MMTLVAGPSTRSCCKSGLQGSLEGRRGGGARCRPKPTLRATSRTVHTLACQVTPLPQRSRSGMGVRRYWALRATPEKPLPGQEFEGLSMEELRAASDGASEGLPPKPTTPPAPEVGSPPSTSEPGKSKDGAEAHAADGKNISSLPMKMLARVLGLLASALAAVKKSARDAVLFFLPARRLAGELRRLREELMADPSPAKRAELARVLNKSKRHGEVIQLWDQSGRQGAVNDSFAVEYVQAMVLSGKIQNFAAERVAREGDSGISMANFLEHCQERLGNKPVSTPGASPLSPMHMIVQQIQEQQPHRGWFTTAMGYLTRWVVVPACLVMFMLVGLVAFKANTLSTTTVGVAPGTSVSTPTPTSTNSVFAAKEYNKDTVPEKSKKTFADVRGCDEAKAEVSEIVEFLKHPEKFTKLGGKLPKGVLLTGPPGTGKTLLAKAIAGEAGVPFFFRSGSEFDEMLVGVGSLRVRNLFAAAKKASPCIIFIDEIDAVGTARNSSFDTGSSKTLNQLLVEMDGFEVNEGVVVIAATNLEGKLDQALLRPGRFDRQVAVPLPDVRGRLDIIDYYLKGKPLGGDVDSQVLARRTPGFSGADLSNLINEAALSAAKNNKDCIAASTLDEARDKVLMGNPRPSMVQTAEGRKLTAYHEAGHALVALNTPGATPIHKATIVPRGHALGMVSMVPHQDEYSITRQQMRAGIDVSMGGRVAEELVFGEDQVTSGATSDLKHATRQARHMIMECGMSQEIGPVYVSEEKSAETRKMIDSEITRMLREAHSRVTTMLTEKHADLDTLARALLAHETLTAQEIEDVLKGSLSKEPVAPKEAESDVAALLGTGPGGGGAAEPLNSGGGPLPSPAGGNDDSLAQR